MMLLFILGADNVHRPGEYEYCKRPGPSIGTGYQRTRCNHSPHTPLRFRNQSDSDVLPASLKHAYGGLIYTDATLRAPP